MSIVPGFWPNNVGEYDVYCRHRGMPLNEMIAYHTDTLCTLSSHVSDILFSYRNILFNYIQSRKLVSIRYTTSVNNTNKILPPLLLVKIVFGLTGALLFTLHPENYLACRLERC